MSGESDEQSSIWDSALRDVRGLDYWRSVLALCTRSERVVGGPDAGPDAIGRRQLLELFGASLALAGLGACGQRPREKILPYVRSPEQLTPGVPLEYATSMVTDGFAVGLLAKSQEGRPIKVEGNPLHPASLGASGVFEQASVLSLYDPSRLHGPLFRGAPTSWDNALASVRGPRSWRPWFVLPPQSSPAVQAWVGRVRERYPEARFTFYSAFSRDALYQAAAAVFGRPLEQQYDFTKSRVVLSLEADFLSQGPMALRWARDFSEGHRPEAPHAGMSRLYQLEALVSSTGSVADERLAVRSGEVPFLAAALLGELRANDPGARSPSLEAFGRLPRADATPHARFIRALAKDLAENRGASIVLAGERQPFQTHVLALALNAALGNVGKTVRLTASALEGPVAGEPLPALVEALRARSVDAVLILEANPVHTAPPELELARWLGEAPTTLHLTYQANETSRACQWVVPLSHYLESWGDARAYDGTLSFQQPLIEPIYPARSILELMAAVAGEAVPRGHELLVSHWRAERGPRFGAEWEQFLREGVAPGSAFPEVAPSGDWERAFVLARTALRAPAAAGLELGLTPSRAVYDGRFANNAWLLELPDPITKQSWGNALWMAPEDAAELGVSTGSVVELAAGTQSLRAPVLIVPGQAKGALGLAAGYGRQGNRALSDGVGVDGYRLRAADGSATRRVELRVTGEQEALAIPRAVQSDHGRDLVYSRTLAEYRRDPDFTRASRGAQPSLLPVFSERQTGPAAHLQWAMTIDTTLCTGCSACVVACQAENNVPVVGKAEVQRAREMHWLRIDSYFEPEGPAHQRVHQPMLCQHCETAPCEYVCPVNATVHSPDGLNEMVYNRCIGTRFCSNNCPYKVRRFNWFEYTEADPLLRLQRNPEVTVRERGVMEKCTFCVQRIRSAERQARIERREVRPDEVRTACQQACSTQAIQFGSLGHAQAPVVQWRREPRAYSALHELGTRPRTLYLAKIKNPNPELEG